MGRKRSLASLRKEAARLQQKSIVSRIKKAARNIPETSTRFQLELDIAARKAAKKETRKLKKKGKKAILSFLSDLKRGRI